MSGFTATADPLTDPDYRVIDALKSDFLPRRGGQSHAELAGTFVLVLPVDQPRPVVRDKRMI